MLKTTIDGKRISSRSWFTLRQSQSLSNEEISDIFGISKGQIQGIRSDPPQWLAAIYLLLGRADPETIAELMNFRNIMPRWQQIKDFPAYEVSDVGDVRRIEQGRFKTAGHMLKPQLSRGYKMVNLYGPDKKMKSALVHRLVATAFARKRAGKNFVCHKNGQRLDCRASNLYWGDAASNGRDRARHVSEAKAARNRARLNKLENLGHTGGTVMPVLNSLEGVIYDDIKELHETSGITELALGKGEAVVSITTGSTIFPKQNQ